VTTVGLLYFAAYLILVKRVETVRNFTMNFEGIYEPAEMHFVWFDEAALPMFANWYVPLLKADRE